MGQHCVNAGCPFFVNACNDLPAWRLPDAVKRSLPFVATVSSDSRFDACPKRFIDLARRAICARPNPAR